MNCIWPLAPGHADVDSARYDIIWCQGVVLAASTNCKLALLMTLTRL